MWWSYFEERRRRRDQIEQDAMELRIAMGRFAFTEAKARAFALERSQIRLDARKAVYWHEVAWRIAELDGDVPSLDYR
jgi:hypothetical protein